MPQVKQENHQVKEEEMLLPNQDELRHHQNQKNNEITQRYISIKSGF